MIKLENEQICMFDVDDTLVMWGDDFNTPSDDRIRIVDPYDNSAVYLKPHQKHIRLVKQMHARGRLVCVWSGGGVRWAETVVKALGLEPYVHMVMTKPICYVDDLPANDWLNNRIYLGEIKNEQRN